MFSLKPGAMARLSFIRTMRISNVRSYVRANTKQSAPMGKARTRRYEMTVDATSQHVLPHYHSLSHHSDDIDIFMTRLSANVISNIISRHGKKKSSIRLVDMFTLAAVFGEDVCTDLLGCHAWTGLDTIGLRDAGCVPINITASYQLQS